MEKRVLVQVESKSKGTKLTLVTTGGDSQEFYFEKLPEVGDVVSFKGKFYKIRQFHWHCTEQDEDIDAKIATYCASLEVLVPENEPFDDGKVRLLKPVILHD